MRTVRVLQKFDEANGLRYKNYFSMVVPHNRTVEELLREQERYIVNGYCTTADPDDAIWTHKPVPVDFDLQAAKSMFESAALKCLSDHDYCPSFESDPAYPDGRYKEPAIRAAWMVFIERESGEMEDQLKLEQRLGAKEAAQYTPNVGQVLDAVRLKQIDETNKPVELPKMPPHRTPLEIDGWDECIEAIKELGPLYTSPFGLAQKYDDVLLPFIGLMRHELHANSHKGDRRAWLCMGHNQSILEGYHHMAKLANAVRDGNLAGIREHTADVANIAMMIADIHGAWNCESEQAEHEAQALGLRS